MALSAALKRGLVLEGELEGIPEDQRGDAVAASIDSANLPDGWVENYLHGLALQLVLRKEKSSKVRKTLSLKLVILTVPIQYAMECATCNGIAPLTLCPIDKSNMTLDKCATCNGVAPLTLCLIDKSIVCPCNLQWHCTLHLFLCKV